MKREKRIVSLLPSATEIVCALGAGSQLVGRSHECDEPEEVLELPVVTKPRLQSDGSSREVHDEVTRLVREGLSVYEVDADVLRALEPDVVVTQSLCDVCAVSVTDVERALSDWTDRDVRLVDLAPTTFQDVLEDFYKVGRAIDRRDEARAVVRALEERRFYVERRATLADIRPAVCTIEWLDPVLLGGTWMPDLIRAAGGEPLGVRSGEKSRPVDRSILKSLAPDVVLVKPCGFRLDRTLRELETLRRNLPWDRWPAVAEGRVYVADGHRFFNRPGPRLLDSLEILAACIHPGLFEEFRERYADAVRRIAPDLAVTPLPA